LNIKTENLPVHFKVVGMIYVRGLVVVINTTNFFCFTCVFFRVEKEWSFHGISTTKNIIIKAEKHAISKTYLKNQEQFHLLGKIRIKHAISD
jgi:hypothetical protein